MKDFSTTGQNTDLHAHARLLAETHEAVIGGSAPRVRPRGIVARSWTRALALGLDPAGRNSRDPLPAERVELLRRESPLGSVIEELRGLISTVADASRFLLVVADDDGVILWREGAADVARRADELGFVSGTRWAESVVGTNAIGTALAESAPVELFSAEHFEQPQHPWYCTAAPIHDPRTGEPLGVVDISGPALKLHPTVGALVGTAVRFAELSLWREHQRELEQLRTAAAPWLAGTRGPWLLVDGHGWVAHSSGVTAGQRTAVPRADRPVAVAGMGLCFAEPLAGGWLVRPHGEEVALRLLLDLSTSTPAIEVGGRGTPWRSSLGKRHAEILLVLRLAGVEGVSTATLSCCLHGDAEHTVAARAEMSRLRRLLGGVIEAKPYRAAPGVELRVELGTTERVEDCTFVRDSASPGVLAFARRQAPLRGE
ncbi:GAF domain-containing protein [Actinopolyspora halophila]|uniref:GAF domain-containing protein n=1 Tax=Actinopolyspora halophila TaxID=1850 RepID=UPI000475A8DB|nr:GAF domain-containing protein [Actinopolyspora halophila]